MERRGRLHWSLTRVLLHSGTPSLPSHFSCKQLSLASDPYQNPGLALSVSFHYVPLQRRLALARYPHHPSVDSPCADISRAAHATGLVGVLALVAEVAQGLCDRLRGFEPRAHEVPAIQTSVCCCLLSRRSKRPSTITAAAASRRRSPASPRHSDAGAVGGCLPSPRRSWRRSATCCPAGWHARAARC